MMSVTSLQRSAVASRSLRAAATPLPVNRAMRVVRRTQEKTKSESGGDLTQDELKEVRFDMSNNPISHSSEELRRVSYVCATGVPQRLAPCAAAACIQLPR